MKFDKNSIEAAIDEINGVTGEIESSASEIVTSIATLTNVWKGDAAVKNGSTINSVYGAFATMYNEFMIEFKRSFDSLVSALSEMNVAMGGGEISPEKAISVPDISNTFTFEDGTSTIPKTEIQSAVSNICESMGTLITKFTSFGEKVAAQIGDGGAAIDTNETGSNPASTFNKDVTDILDKYIAERVNNENNGLKVVLNNLETIVTNIDSL